ncbi:uncharacterized protein [Diabrotica undecimpunctata]|uniref:uncharacterized protein n=1 Tax=Diabrotica undecimpunctata TaxID=50387 RepID=UPI003B6418BD
MERNEYITKSFELLNDPYSYKKIPKDLLTPLEKSIIDTSFSSYNTYKIKDAFEFANKINGFLLPLGYVLASFDVTLLFTNIPLELVVSILTTNYHLIKPNCTIPKVLLLKLITFLYNNTYFTFLNDFYVQIKGAPMGGAISPSLAEIAMNSLLHYCTREVDFQFPFTYQYVDDLICAVPANKINYTLNIFISYNTHLQFTVQTEKNNIVPFLDTNVSRHEGNTIRLYWYRKKTFSGRYVPFHSYHLDEQKINIIKGLKNRIERICHPSNYNKNIMLLYEILRKNHYPKMLLNKLLFQDMPTARTHQQQAIEREAIEL